MKILTVLALTLIGIKVSTAAGLFCTNDETDIIFALDASNGVTELQFTLQKQFAANVSGAFEAGPDDTQFGALVFRKGEANTVSFLFYDYDLNWEISQALLEIPFQRPFYPSFRKDPVLYEAQWMFSFAGRENAAKVVIVIIEGSSFDSSWTQQSVTDLKDRNVIIFVVAIGDALPSKLLTIASQPDYVFKADSFNVIQTLKDGVEEKICQALGGKPEGATMGVCTWNQAKDSTMLPVARVLSLSGSVADATGSVLTFGMKIN